MSWLLGGIYCGILWLVFAKLKLFKLTLPLAVLAASIGPALIITLLFCAQYYHPFTSDARVFQEVVPVIPQLRQAGRVTEVTVKPNTPVKKGQVLFRVDAVPYENTVAKLTAALDEAKQSEKVADASVDLAKATLTRATANLEFATSDRDRNAKLVQTSAVSQQDYEASKNRYTEADAAITQAKASLTQAKLSIDLAKAKTEQTKTQLAESKYDLEQTTVTAPGDGFVTNLQLRPGMLVGGAGSGAVMSFVQDRNDMTRGMVVATFDQKNYLRIKAGLYAEVALHGYPGEIFTGRVITTIDISGEGQMTASGILPSDLGGAKPTRFAVRIKLDKGDELRLPAGSQAHVAVYSQDVQIAGIPIMFLIRAHSWLNYVM
jgi:multidrug resistance efflux pump